VSVVVVVVVGITNKIITTTIPISITG